tara:strand:- start:611 stop:775 length:165 start_codon:yes stop_codon:yes gene_type:complete
MILNITNEEAKIIRIALQNEKEVVYRDTAENHNEYHNEIDNIIHKLILNNLEYK